jgi:hypothetical protein
MKSNNPNFHYRQILTQHQTFTKRYQYGKARDGGGCGMSAARSD